MIFESFMIFYDILHGKDFSYHTWANSCVDLVSITIRDKLLRGFSFTNTVSVLKIFTLINFP